MAVAKDLRFLLLFSSILICLPQSLSFADQTNCKSYRFSTNQDYQFCTDLRVLSSFLHWTYYPATLTADIAFRKPATSTTSWIAWSLNPSGQTMLGSQALVAFHNSSGVVTAYTTQIDTYHPSMQYANLSFGVSNIRAEYANNEMIIFARLHLDNALIKTNQVWQEGPMSGTNFTMHVANQKSVGTIDFSTGLTTEAANSNKKKNIHGILNVVGWGILIPIGLIVKRCGCYDCGEIIVLAGWVIGIAGWGTGMKLGQDSHGITHGTHRILGIVVFSLSLVCGCCGTPGEFVVLVLSIVNIYEGFQILQPDHHKWRDIYTGVLIFFGCVSTVVEIIRCVFWPFFYSS